MTRRPDDETLADGILALVLVPRFAGPRGRGEAIIRVTRTIITKGPTVAAGEDTLRTDNRRAVVGVVMALARSLFVIVLVALAILVLLPAAIAAQAASAV